MKTKGSVGFAGLSGTAAAWSERLSKAVGHPVAESSVAAYRCGSRNPPRDVQEAIHAAGGPPPEAWTEAVPSTPVRRPREAHAAEAPTPDAVAGEAAKLLAHIRDLQDELTDLGTGGGGEDAPGVALDKRVTMADKLSSAITRLGTITGTRITPRAILASPHWAELEDTIVKALEPWPDAMRAVSGALDSVRAS